MNISVVWVVFVHISKLYIPVKLIYTVREVSYPLSGSSRFGLRYILLWAYNGSLQIDACITVCYHGRQVVRGLSNLAFYALRTRCQ